MKCIDCGREGDGRFCGECGSKMLGERTDNNLICCGKLEDGSPCGTVLFATQNFCKSCGTRVEHTLLKAVADNLNFKEDGSCRPSGDSGNFGDSDDEPLIQMSEEQLTPFKPVRSMPVECKQEACVVVEIEPEVKVTAWSPSDTEIDGENDEDEGGGDDDDDGGGDGNDDVDDNDVDDDDVNDDDVDDDDDSDVHKQSSSRKRKRHKTKYTIFHRVWRSSRPPQVIIILKHKLLVRLQAIRSVTGTMTQKCQKRRKIGDDEALAHLSERTEAEKFQVSFIDTYIGNGVFAKQNIRAVDLLMEYSGKLLHGAPDQDTSYVYYFPRGCNTCIDATDNACMARMVNDIDNATKANCKMKKVAVHGDPCLALYALKDIEKGAALRYDYGDGKAPWRKGKEERNIMVPMLLQVQEIMFIQRITKKTRRKKAKRSKKEICALSVQRNKYGETPLHKACIKGELEKVKKLIADGHPINVHDHSGWSPLHEASNNKWYDVAECLLKHGANIDDPGGDECQGMTPLVDAASVGCLDLVELLLEYGANTMAQDDDKMTALDHLVKLHEEDSDEDEDTEAQFTTIVELLEKRMIADKGKKKVKHLPKSRQCAIRLKSDSSNSKLRERQEIRKKNCKKRRTSKRNAVAESDSDSDSDGTSSSNSRKISITSSPSSDDLDTDGSTSTIIVDYSKDSGSNGIAPCQNGSSDTEQQSTSRSRRGKLKTRTKLETPPPDRPRSKRSIRSDALPGRSRSKRNNRPETPPPGPSRPKKTVRSETSPGRSRPKRNIRSSTPPSRSRPKRNMRSETPPSHSRPKRNTRSQTPPSRSRSKRIIRSVTPPSHSRLNRNKSDSPRRRPSAQTKRGPGRPRGPPRGLKNLRAGRGRRRGHIEERTNIGIGLTEDSRISRANGASTSASAECGDNLSTSQTHGIKASVSVTSEVDAFDDDGNLSSSTDIFKDSDTNTSDIEIPFKTEYSDDSYLLAF